MSHSRTWVKRIVDSPFFKEAMEKSTLLFNQNQVGLLTLIKGALQKVQETAATNNLTVVKLLNRYIVLFSELIKSYVQGSYTKLPLVTLVKITAALLYFVMPFDFIPDFLPFVGFADDLAIVVWVGKAIKEELDEFEKHL
ncbi:YkvA family protein [Aquirufa sp. HETE-83D]|uniref:YkvA family protein n=1 Tax=Aquirufa esocilacus TaxID=3096513 RepID=A0ABW6DGP0_9BACT